MTTKQAIKTRVAPLIDKRKRKSALSQAKGIWKHKKKQVEKEYQKIRREWD